MVLQNLLGTSFASGRQLLSRLLGTLIRKKRKYWGIVFDEKKSEGVPFAVVRIFRERELVETVATDISGRYGLILEEAGEYTLEVKAAGYEQYSKWMEIKKETINNLEIVQDIPLVQRGEKMNLIKRFWSHSKPKMIEVLQIINIITISIGTILTLYAYNLSPLTLNAIVLFVYILLLAINIKFLYEAYVGSTGVVKDAKTKQGVGGASVLLYQEGKQSGLGLTNSNGVVKLKVKTGKYNIVVNKTGFTQYKAKNIKIDKGGFFEQNLVISKK